MTLVERESAEAWARTIERKSAEVNDSSAIYGNEVPLVHPQVDSRPAFSYPITIFNAWPQCRTKQDCNKNRQCLSGCSSVKGHRFTSAPMRCPWDDWKSNREIA